MEDYDRLDRIEALVEKIGQRVDSNARAIEAISANTAEYQRDRARMYELMGDLAQAQADLAQAQAEGKREMYRILDNLDQRQGQLSQQQEQFARQNEQLSQQQEQFARQNEQLSQRQGEIVEILKLLVNSQKGAATDR